MKATNRAKPKRRKREPPPKKHDPMKMREQVLPGLMQNAIEAGKVSYDMIELAAEFGYRSCERNENIQMMRSNLLKLFTETQKDAGGFIPGHYYVVEDAGAQKVWCRGHDCWLVPGSDDGSPDVDRVIGEVDLATGKIMPLDDREAPHRVDGDAVNRIPSRFILRRGPLYVYSIDIKGKLLRTHFTFKTTNTKKYALCLTQKDAHLWARRINMTVGNKGRFLVTALEE